MTSVVHFQQSTPTLITKQLSVISPPRSSPATLELCNSMVMNMTMAQLYGTLPKGKRSYPRGVTEMFAAMEVAIAKAENRNPAVKTDEVILAALAILQMMWDRRMDELRSATSEPKRPERRRQKSNRLTGFLE